MKPLLFTIIVIIGVSVAQLTFAQETGKIYKSLVELPINLGSDRTEEFVRILYILSVSVAAFLAFVKIIFGGVKYMLSDVITNKEDAKKDIRGALIGLLIVISAFLVLNTINPQLVQLNIFGDAPGVDVELGDHGNATPKTSCEQFGENSAQCCQFKGGNFAVIAGAPKCNVGAPLPNFPTTGDPITDRANCIDLNNAWNGVTNQCMEKPISEMDLLPGAEDIDPNDPNNHGLLQNFCLAGWEYRPSTNTCISRL